MVAFLAATWLGRVVASYGFYYADVPIFADMNTLLRKNLLGTSCAAPGHRPCPILPAKPSAVSETM